MGSLAFGSWELNVRGCPGSGCVQAAFGGRDWQLLASALAFFSQHCLPLPGGLVGLIGLLYLHGHGVWFRNARVTGFDVPRPSSGLWLENQERGGFPPGVLLRG